MHTNRELLAVARAEALFTSPMNTGSQPTAAEVRDAIRDSLRSHRGIRGCVDGLAAAYGDCPEIASIRMRWARRVVAAIYPPGADR